MDFEFTTIEHYEDPQANWRRSFAEGLEIKIDDLRLERSAQSKREVWLDDRCYRIASLSDSKLEAVARREVERDVNRAIIERKEATSVARSRHRAGMAF